VIPEIGHAALWLATMFAILQGVAPVLGLRADGEDWLGWSRRAAIAQGVLTLGAFLALMRSFAVSDFSVALVAANSHTLKPMLYKLTGVWGNHEGSMLLWVTVLGVSGAAVALSPQAAMTERFRARVLQAQALIGLGFYAFLLLASNPFARLDPAPLQGNGLNPLLQDPGLAFHPPMLYVGYVGFSVAFAFAIAAMYERAVGPAWARLVRPWVLGAWATLTAGIALGSWWAYYELGWGGYWFWDPVENASLMPWLAGTALLHSLAVLAKRDALRNWTVLLAVVAFSLSMVGTFIVRSGILTSVHAFAVDPERGTFLLLLLGIYIGGALLLYARAASRVEVGSGFAPVSREGSLVANNLLLSALLGIVIVGTLYPLALEALTGDKLSVGPPYFHATFVPVGLLLLVLLGLGPLLAWRRTAGRAIVRKLLLPALVTLLGTLAAIPGWAHAGPMPLVGLAVAIWVAAATLQLLFRRNLARMPLATWGMVLAHLGVAVSLFGLSASTALTREGLAAVPVGGTVAFGPYEARLAGIAPVAGPNFTAIEALLVVTRDGREVARMRPQSRTYTSPIMETTEAAIRPLWNGDLFAVVGQPDGRGRWQVRMHWRPFITMIWAGALLMAAGGVLATGNRLRLRLARRGERSFTGAAAYPSAAE
jgi:cytochrome c-type biogenesis protein CcmF